MSKAHSTVRNKPALDENAQALAPIVSKFFVDVLKRAAKDISEVRKKCGFEQVDDFNKARLADELAAKKNKAKKKKSPKEGADNMEDSVSTSRSIKIHSYASVPAGGSTNAKNWETVKATEQRWRRRSSCARAASACRANALPSAAPPLPSVA